MRLAMAVLADMANIREGLMNVLSAGITRMGRSSFPTSLDIALALLVEVYTGEEVDALSISVTFGHENGDEMGKIDIGVETQLDHTSGGTIPIVLPLSSFEVPGPGRYFLRVQLQGHQPQRIELNVEQAEAPPT